MKIDEKKRYFDYIVDFILSHELIPKDDKDIIDKYKSSGFKVKSIVFSKTGLWIIDESLEFTSVNEDCIKVEWVGSISKMSQKIKLDSKKLLSEFKKFIDEKIHMDALKEMGDEK